MISIVVPAFNEKENIHELLSRISLSLGSRNIPYEVVVIDDYSTDGTWELLQQEQGNFPPKTDGVFFLCERIRRPCCLRCNRCGGASF